MIRRYARIRQVGLKPRRGQIRDDAYRRWVKSQPCIIQNKSCWGPIDPHHVGHYGQGRANDYNTVPLCRRHHDQAQSLRRVEFESRYGISFSAAITGLNDEYRVRRVA
jgi:hypothetical protein